MSAAILSAESLQTRQAAIFYILHYITCVHAEWSVCVCVCEREREPAWPNCEAGKQGLGAIPLQLSPLFKSCGHCRHCLLTLFLDHN